jgi:porin
MIEGSLNTNTNHTQKARWIIVAGLFLSFLTTSVVAQDEDGFFEPRHLVSYPDNLKKDLENYGITLDLIAVGEGFWNTHGGLNTHKSGEFLGDLMLIVEADTEKLGWWEGGTFSLTLEGLKGHGIDEDHVGSVMCVSNLECREFAQVSELWFRQWFFDHQLWLKIGKMDANAEFARIDYGADFLHACGAMAPNIPMPTFPDPDWGLVIGTDPEAPFSLTAGVYQGVPDGSRSIGDTLEHLDGPMVMVEPNFRYQIKGHPGRLALGGWWNGASFDKLDADAEVPSTVGSNYGFYVTLEQELWKENPGCEEDAQGIGMYLQYSWAPKDRNEIDNFLGAGVQWTGPLPGRDEDILGAAVYHSTLSEDAGYSSDSETSAEVFYKIQVTPNLSLKPDVQYIANPGGGDSKDALVVGMRMEMTF